MQSLLAKAHKATVLHAICIVDHCLEIKHNLIMKGNCAQARLDLEQPEYEAAGDWRGG